MSKENNYGITIKDLPDTLSLRTVKKILQISELISFVDFIDAYSTRTTLLKIQNSNDTSLQNMLYNRFPGSETTINLALELYHKANP